MPRLVFDSIEEFNKWTKDFVRKERHKVYVTSSNEVIIVPLVSTRPIEIPYIEVPKADDLGKVKEALPGGIRTYVLDRFDWRMDREVKERIYFLGE